MRPRLAHVLLILALLPLSVPRAQLVLTGTAGAASGDHFSGARFAWGAALYLKFDEQVLIGVQGGQGSVAGERTFPVTSSAIVRLPIGRVVLPVATGDAGYAGGDHPGLVLRAGGGFDIRNGRRSSFLVLGGYEQQGGYVGWFGRGGLLLEF